MTPGVQITLIICGTIIALFAIIAFSPTNKKPKE